jgi:hypothetical protein
MTFRNGQPYRPETEIQHNIINRRAELDLTTAEVARRVAESDLYGDFSHSTLRNLERQDFEDPSSPRTTLNKQLIIALSEALECPVAVLADGYQLSAIRDVPYRRAQWPEFMLAEEAETAPRNSVASPELTAKRAYWYFRQHGYNDVTAIHQAMRHFRINISEATTRRVFGKRPEAKVRARVLTYEFCEKLAVIFRAKGSPEFQTDWLLRCQDRCPHCRPDLYAC